MPAELVEIAAEFIAPVIVLAAMLAMLLLIFSFAVLRPAEFVEILLEFVIIEPALEATPIMFMATPAIAVLRP